MAFSINTNVTSLEAQNYLTKSSAFQAQTINRVTSGLRIVNSGDDAAGLAVANGLSSQQAVLTQGIQNANNGLSTLQTIDSGMGNINTLLDRAQTLATESASGTFSGDRGTLNSEFQSVMTEINRQAQSIGLNNGGQFAKALSVFIGGGQGSNAAAQAANGTINIDLSKSSVDAASLGLQGTQAAGKGSTYSVANIISDTVNKASEAVAGQTQFTFRGAGFSDTNGVTIAVNLAGVTDMNSLATAVNSAIQGAAGGSGSAAAAFKAANVVASVTSDANGNQALAFSSSSNAFQVQAGDLTANALMGNFNNLATSASTSTAATVDTSTNKTLAIAWDGAAATTYTLSAANVTTSTSISNIAADLNSQATFSSKGKAYVDAANHLIIQSNTTGTTSSVAVTSTLATTLGFSGTATVSDAGAGQSVTSTVTAGTAAAAAGATNASAGNIIVRFQGAGLSSPVDLKLTVTGGTTTTAQVITALQTAVQGNAQLKAAGITTGTNFSNGNTLTFNNSQNQLFNVQVAGDLTNILGFGTNQLANATTASSLDYSSITASAASSAGAATLQFSAGGGTTFAVTATLAGAATDADALNTQFAASTQATAAGLHATYAGGKLTIASTNGTNFLLNEKEVGGFGGFSAVPGSNVSTAGATYATGQAPQSNALVAGGAQATQAIGFTALNYGNDSQTVNISATDANGVQHTSDVVLKNNLGTTGGNNNGSSIDTAISAINSQLQGSGDSTLQNIVAVKQNVNGVDQIGFVGTGNFQVTSGTTNSGSGLQSQGQTLTSSLSAGGNTISIASAQGATTAINALTAAISKFGNAQAAVGRGENNLNYAVSLAQNQATSDASAESTIKDANLAQEAANLTKAQILVQAGTAALAQANSAPQQLLSLLQGH